MLGVCLRRITSFDALRYSEEQNDYAAHFSSGLSTPSKHESLEEQKVQLCDWYGKDDPEHPLNWQSSKKVLVVITIASYAFVVYMSAPIWTPSEEQFMQEYGTGYEYTTLGLALFVYV